MCIRDRVIKQYETVVIATNPYENAQICCGGVDTRQIEPATMESKLIKGLYFAGEIVDVDGICGGYNLQWAWTSGYIAGLHCCDQENVSENRETERENR